MPATSKSKFVEKMTPDAKCARFLITFCAILAMAVLPMCLVIACVHRDEIDGGKSGAKKEFLYFEKEGDVGRIIVKRGDRFAYVLKPKKGTVVKSNDGHRIVLQQADRHARVIVDVESGEITAETAENDTIVVTATQVHQPLFVLPFDAVVDITASERAGGNDNKLMRQGPQRELITIDATHAAIIWQRRGSDDVMLQIPPTNGRAADVHTAAESTATVVEDDRLWKEEVLIRPRTLSVVVKNAHGSVYFRKGEAIRINSKLEGNYSGSPFQRKFVRIENENGSLEVSFDDGGCSTARFVDGRRGGQLWMSLSGHSGGVRNAVNDSLQLTRNGHLIGAKNSNETLRVDRHSGTVCLDNAETSVGTAKCGDWQMWRAPTASVRRESECGANTAAWNVTTNAGTVRVSRVVYNEYYLSIADNAFVHAYENWRYAMGQNHALSAYFGCAYEMRVWLVKMTPDGKLFDFANPCVVGMSSSLFDARAAPGRVFIDNYEREGRGLATITGNSATVTITPFQMYFQETIKT